MTKCKVKDCEDNANTVVVWGCENMHVSTVAYCGHHTVMMLSYTAVKCSSCSLLMHVSDALHTDIRNVNEVFLGNDGSRQVQ